MTSARVAAEGRRSAALRAPEEGRRESFRSRLRIVDRAAPERRHIGWFAGIAVVVMLFVIAGAHTLIISEQAHIDRVNNRIAEAETRAELLRVELAKLQSPQNVTSAATTRLGMIPAPTPVYLQPKATDDARAAEMPPPPTPTTIARSSATTAPSSALTSSAKTTTPTTVAATAGQR